MCVLKYFQSRVENIKVYLLILTHVMGMLCPEDFTTYNYDTFCKFVFFKYNLCLNSKDILINLVSLLTKIILNNCINLVSQSTKITVHNIIDSGSTDF